MHLILLLFEDEWLGRKAAVSEGNVVLLHGSRETALGHIVADAERVHRVDRLRPVELVVRAVELAQAPRVCLARGPPRRPVARLGRRRVLRLPVHVLGVVGARGMLTRVLRAVSEALGRVALEHLHRALDLAADV